MRFPGRGWRPALRIARRQVRRNVGRSVFIAVLVGLPAAGATMVDILYRSTEDPQREAYRVMGDADALVEVTGFETLNQPEADIVYFPSISYGTFPAATPSRKPADVDVASLLPEGSTIVPGPVNYDARIDAGDRTVRTDLTVVVAGQPMTEHVARLRSGHWPADDDEVVLSTALAERLGLAAGASVTLYEGPQLRVAGTFVDPFGLSSEWIIAAPGSAAAGHAAAAGPDTGYSRYSFMGGPNYLVDLPDAVNPDELWPRLAEQGVRLVPRVAVTDPERYLPGGYDTPTPLRLASLRSNWLVALTVGIGLLEVVLLAGAAFAVGARRQVRELGLMAAEGATAAQIRRTVIASGLVLGAIGAAAGIAVGAVATVVARPAWEGFLDELIEGWRFGPAEIAGAAAIAVLAGLAAAVVPALGAARMKPVDALAGRFRTSRLAARLPFAGLLLFGIGAGGALIASRLVAGNLRAYAEHLEASVGTGHWTPAPTTWPYITVQLGGAAIAAAGLVIMLPGLVSLIGRWARHLGLSARLAVRDAARHRHRTAPTVAAIAIVVAGSTAVAFGTAGLERASELQYVPSLPPDVIQITVDEYDGDTGRPLDPAEVEARRSAAEDAATEALPGSSVLRVDNVATEMSGEPPTPFWTWLSSVQPCPTCFPASTGSVSTGLGVADPALIDMVSGHTPDADMREALAEGRIVVFDDTYVDDDGTVPIPVQAADDEVTVRLPAYVADRDVAYTSVLGAFVSEDVVAEQGWFTSPLQSMVSVDGATADQVDAALDAVEAAGGWAYVEERPDESTDPAVLALSAGSALVTFIGVAIAVSLAAVEGRADLATLAAVGAPPSRRRRLAGAQALLVGGLGALLGVALGVYFAYLVWPAIGAPDFIWAWDSLVLTGLVVPLLAVLVAVIFTPSRLPMIRRVE